MADTNGWYRGRGVAVLLLALLGACPLEPREVASLDDAVLCDIVAHRDSSRRVRLAARDELALREAQCDELGAVMCRRQIDDLRARMKDDPGGAGGRPTYTDCVLSPICNETE